jgi:hypothetical protein
MTNEDEPYMMIVVVRRLLVPVSDATQECQGRAAASTSTPTAAPAAPPALTGLSSSGGGGAHDHHHQQIEEEDEGSGRPAITFKLLMKKGGKDDRSRELHVRLQWGNISRKGRVCCPSRCLHTSLGLVSVGPPMAVVCA